jgi:GNAT superfamily N-acetyltransferase
VTKLVFREVTRARWPDFVKLFEARGGPKYWCMAWRAQGKEVQLAAPGRKRAMARRVRAGVPVGILAYRDGEPVAWCSIAPRETYARTLGGEAADGVWSLACFFVPRPLRRAGLMRALIEAAVTHARARGAKIVEAYPVDADSPSYRFMGFVEVFAKAGFREVGRAGTRRQVMRRAVQP